MDCDTLIGILAGVGIGFGWTAGFLIGWAKWGPSK